MTDDDFDQHPVWPIFNAIDDSLQSFSSIVKQDRRYIDLSKMLDYLKWVLRNSDSALISEVDLDRTRDEMRSLLSLLPNDAAAFANIVSISQELSSALGRFGYPRVRKFFRSESQEAINQIIGQIRDLEKDVALSRREFEEAWQISIMERDASKQHVDELVLKLANAKQQIDGLVSAWELQADAKVEAKLTGIGTDFIIQQNERLARVQEFENNASFALSQVSVKSSELEARNERETAALRASLSSIMSAFEAEAAAHVKSIADLFSVAGKNALAGGFVSAAVEERELYRNNAWYAKLAFSIGAVSLGGISFFLLQSGQHDLKELLLRLPISIAFFVPGIYFSPLASKHRSIGVGLQSLGLRIAAFDAYIVNSEKEERSKLRGELARTFFEERRKQDALSPDELSLTTKVVDRLSGVVEKAVDKALSATGTKSEQ